MTNAGPQSPLEVEVAVVGTGFSGLCMAIQLKHAGIESFVVLEKAGRVGGTWRENRYPGAACDVPSHLYSFSFEQNPAWTRAFSPQPEILDYLESCADKYGVRPAIRFGFAVESADFDAATGRWTIRAGDGRIVHARALVLGNGALHVPAYPDIPGLDTFTGKRFHSAEWDHDLDPRGKRIGLIGTGASAIQIVPELAGVADKLHVFQRSPAWVMPKPDHAIAPLTRTLYARVPGLQRLVRASIYWRLEWRALGFSRPGVLRLAEPLVRRYIAAKVQDPTLRAALTPDYRMGCKRILLSNDYYPALQRPGVEVVTTGIERVEPTGVRTRDGALRELDALVLGTGFRVNEYLSTIRITGPGGRELNASWHGNPGAYLGITVAGFPNLFLLMGPNTGLGHNSMIFMIEAQVRYALQCIQTLQQRGLKTLEVRPEVQEAFNAELQTSLERSVWASGCNSWYQGEDGRNSALWPGFTVDYWRRTRRVKLDDFQLR